MHATTCVERPFPSRRTYWVRIRLRRRLVKRSTHELTPRGRTPRAGSGIPCGIQMLLRKEVIQPHLPVRLPCYDLVLITDPTFDGSLHKGWATGFGCYRLS